MPDTIDLAPYFERIGYAGPARPDLETLRELHLRHAQAIPFENLNPLLRWPVRLDLQALQEKIVLGGRGGYCFEQNLLFSHVLEAIGFRLVRMAARVLWNRPEDAIAPRSHMLLRVQVEGEPYIADVGFGGLTLTGPLRLAVDIEQETPHEPFRVTRAGDDYKLQAKIGEAWRTLYRFDLQREYQVDYEISSYYLTTHPASQFVAGLIAARPAPDRRYALSDNKLAVHRLSGETERRTITSAAELRDVLVRDFLISLPDDPELEATLARIAAR
jgi:N-hydroxyarylamine O-acetyltransferase